MSTTKAAPEKKGCFHLEYPSNEWKEVSCGDEPADAPQTMRVDRQQTITPAAQPLAGDYMISPSQSISSATGTVISENNVNSVSGGYGLQLNSNMGLPAPSCGGSANTSCSGWIQFVYTSSQQLFIQYWFINYLTDGTKSCPDGMKFKSGLSCGTNAVFSTLSAAPSDFKALRGATLTGQVDGHGGVSATLTVGSQSFRISGEDKVGANGTAWTKAEFNVFGISGGSTVNFNQDAEIQIGLAVNNDTSGKEPGCSTGSTTAENSNLFLGPCFTTTSPSIWFNESPLVPQVSGISPGSGNSSGGTAVNLVGGPFNRAVQLKFGEQTVLPMDISFSKVSVVSPPGIVGSQVNLTAAYIFPDGSPGPFSAPSAAGLFTYVKVPICTFSDFCPFLENQPPTYTVVCESASDFYNYVGVPADPASPTGMTLVQLNANSNTALTSAEELGLAACVPGTKNNCYVHSIEVEQKNWCLNNKPPAPPPRCTACGDKKCCPDPFGGIGHVCEPLTFPCPPPQ